MSNRPARKESSEGLRYMPQMDAVRAGAVFMVIMTHWMPAYSSIFFNGYIGVRLFFVISGFLITGILLDVRRKAEKMGVPKKHVLRNFYIRRFLRIFPLYYAVLAVTYLLNFENVRNSIFWHAAYLSNFYFAVIGQWQGEVSHFWTLAVEEQFYLMWPLVILFTPTKNMLSTVAGFILTAPICRFIMLHYWNANEVAVITVPFNSFDALGLGALFAYVQRFPQSIQLRHWVFGFSMLAVACGVCLGSFLGRECCTDLMLSIGPTFQVLGCLAVVYVAAIRVKGWPGKVLEWPLLLYIGKISYGLYIYHNFIPLGVKKYQAAFGVNVIPGNHIVFSNLLNASLLFLICTASWYQYEKRINRLKRHFPYV